METATGAPLHQSTTGFFKFYGESFPVDLGSLETVEPPVVELGPDFVVPSGTPFVVLVADLVGGTEPTIASGWSGPPGLDYDGEGLALFVGDLPLVAPGEPDVVFTFGFEATDIYSQRGKDTIQVTITGSQTNNGPVANAGPDFTVPSGATAVQLDGSGSTVDRGNINYSWEAPEGITLSGATTATPRFDAPVVPYGQPDRTITFTLKTHGDWYREDTDTVTVTVKSAAPDTTPPAAPTDDTEITPNADGSITVSGVTEPGATVRATFPDGSIRSVQAASNGSYTIVSAPGQPSGAVSVVAIDAAGNVSPAYVRNVITAPSLQAIQTEIAGYLQDRAMQVASAQPDLVGFLSGNMSGGLNAHVTSGRGRFNFATPAESPVWARLQGNWSETETGQNSFFFGVAGAHAQLNENALIGAMLQFDRTERESGTNTTEGQGYLVGPYFVAKLPTQPLYFEGRYLIGMTENKTSVEGATEEHFDTRRSLASFKVAGKLYYDDLTLTPSLSASRLDDKQEAFTDRAGRRVPEQSVTVTDVSAGLDFAREVSVPQGALTLTGGIAGVWSDIRGTGFASTVIPNRDSRRGRAHLGARYTTENGVVWTIGATCDGLGAELYDNWGLSFGMDMQF